MKPKALAALGQVIDGKSAKGVVADTGEAAWATARTKAATAVLGDQIGPSRPGGVAVQINQQFGRCNGTPGRVMSDDEAIAVDGARERGELKPYNGPPRPGYVIQPPQSRVDAERARRRELEGVVVDVTGQVGDSPKAAEER
jgi:hypothetical protein